MSYRPQEHGAHCYVCPLKGNVVVPPAPARKRLKLILVGEGPGRVEERTGIPFVGPSGKFLDQMLEGFSRQNTHVTNAMLCRGELENDNKVAEVCCAPRLLKELAALPKDIPIGVLGKAAARSVLGVKSIFMARGFVWTAKPIELAAVKTLKTAYDKSLGAYTLRGKIVKKKALSFESQLKARLKWLILKWRRHLSGRTVLPTIHPAFVLRADTWKPILELDMRRMLRVARGERLKLWDTGPYDLIRSAKEFAAVVKQPWGLTVGCDIETRGIVPLEATMLCVGISDGERTVVVDPRRETGDEPTWGPVLVKTMQRFLESRKAVVMHNGYNFDQIVMMQHGFTFR